MAHLLNISAETQPPESWEASSSEIHRSEAPRKLTSDKASLFFAGTATLTRPSFTPEGEESHSAPATVNTPAPKTSLSSDPRMPSLS